MSGGREVIWSIEQRSEGNGLESGYRDLGYLLKTFLLERVLMCGNVWVAQRF